MWVMLKESIFNTDIRIRMGVKENDTNVGYVKGEYMLHRHKNGG